MSEHFRKDAQDPSSEGSASPGNTVWEHVRQGAMHFPRRREPPRHPVRQFIHGLSLPFHLARALRTDAAAWRRYLKVAVIQCLVIVSLSVMIKRSASDAVDSTRSRARKQAPTITLGDEDTARAREALERVKVKVAQSAPVSEEEARALRAALEPLPPSPEAPPARPAVHSSDAPAPPSQVRANFVIEDLAFWAALFATMQLIQWVVIALSRDYHDAISRDASLLTSIEPEDEPLTPRVRVDLKWMGKKLSRRVRAFLVFMAGLPVLMMFTVPLPYTDELLSVLVPLWSAYWLVVFTASKTARAWDDTSGRAPWFLRGWTWLTTKMPGFRWGFLRRYGRFWENRTRSVYSPAVELEKQPWAFAGLAVIRVLAILPLVKCFLRPLIPVAAAHLVLAQRACEPTAPTGLTPSGESFLRG